MEISLIDFSKLLQRDVYRISRIIVALKRPLRRNDTRIPELESNEDSVCFSITLLIVGPCITKSKLLRDTDGERFLSSTNTL